MGASSNPITLKPMIATPKGDESPADMTPHNIQPKAEKGVNRKNSKKAKTGANVSVI